MKYIALCFIILALSSCSNNSNITKYNKIINEADTFKIYKRVNNTLVLKKLIFQPDYLKSLKGILTRHVNSEYQRKFIPNATIEIYKGNKLNGTLLIATSKENSFVNFSSTDFGFGFKLTYGIGMYLDGSD